jgi:membrane protease YdiL (CAAX protease family)
VHDDRFAAELRGFGPAGILAMLIVLSGNFLFQPLSALLVLGWAHRSRTPWSALGYVREARWLRGLVVGTAFGVAFKLVMKAVVMPLLGADPTNARYQFLVGNTAALPWMILAIIVFAGFGEETVFRGYLFERLGKLLGPGAWARAGIVALTAALFGVSHYRDQGVPGVQQATIVGLAFGTIFAITRRLWMLMCAHVAFDLAAVAIIYWNLERRIAHLIFR